MASNGRRVPGDFRMRVMCVAVRWTVGCMLVWTAVILQRSPAICVAGEDSPVTGRSDVVCAAEEFPCGNTSICLDRSLHCDNIRHCPDGEDEEGCHDVYGSLTSLLEGTLLTQHQKLEDVAFDSSFDNCSLENVPSYCECRFFTFMYCQSENLTSVPQGIKGPLSKITTANFLQQEAIYTGIYYLKPIPVLTNNSLHSIPTGAFSDYKGLKIIHIEGNHIPLLTPGPFLGLHNVTFLILMKNEVQAIQPGAFEGLDTLLWLLMQSNKLKELDMQVLLDLKSLGVLDLTENKLTKLGTFPHLEALFWLGLGKNNIQRIEKNTFKNLTSLEVLILKNNQIEDIEETAFSTLVKLIELDISHNRLTSLKPKLFSNLKNLSKLNLEFNLIASFPSTIFQGLRSLKSLDLQGLEINNIDINLFHSLTSLEFIYFKKFLYCSYAPYVRICVPKTDGLSSTEHLLVWPALRMSVWFVALMTSAGNTVVLTWRVLSRKEDRVLSLFIKNLAFADLLMGIYLIAVGAKDVSFRDEYNKYAHAWMSSWHCTACGIIAMVSSEVSVLILSLITLERYHCIRTNVRIVTLAGARYCLAAVWLAGFILAIIPVLKYSQEQGFYSSNGLCFPLHIDDPFLLGWQYSAFVFFGINFSAVILIIVLYVRMFFIIKKDRKSARPVILKKHEDAVLALRFFFIVLTDCLCWIPIVLIKLLALVGVAISHNLYACVVVFILPINSALNPVLYTIAAPTELRRRIEKWLERTLVCLQRFECVVRAGQKTPTSTPLTQSLTTTESTGRSVSSGSILPSSTLTTSSGSEMERCIPHHSRKDSELSTSI